MSPALFRIKTHSEIPIFLLMYALNSLRSTLGKLL